MPDTVNKDSNLLLQKNKQVQVKVILLDEQYSETDYLTGFVKSSTYDISATSNIRRTCSLTMSIPVKEQINVNFEQNWIQHLIELQCGIYSFTESKYIWYRLGRMLMVSADTTFDATTQEVKLSLVDLMASMTSERGSQLGTDLVFKEGSSIKNAIKEVVSVYSPYKRIMPNSEFPDFEDSVPYDLEVASGKYPFDALHELLNLFPYYEMFYDIEGKFCVQMIPTKINDPVDIGAEIIDELLISEQRSVKFSDVKNTTEIWGRSLDAKYTALSCETSGNKYQLFIDDAFETLVVNDTYSFTPTTESVAGQTVQIQNTTECGLYTQAGDGTYIPIEAGKIRANVHYVIKYMDDGTGKFILQGPSLIHVIVQEIDSYPNKGQRTDYMNENGCYDVQWVVNPDSPFACTIAPTTGSISREIKQVLQGEEYENIYTTELAYERASYENWLKTRLQDNVELEMILIPWIDVNQKIEYTSPTSGEVVTLVTQTISFDFANWTMTVKGSKFYPYYPWWDGSGNQ